MSLKVIVNILLILYLFVITYKNWSEKFCENFTII